MSSGAIDIVLFARPPNTPYQRGTEKQKHSQSQHKPLVMPEYLVRVKGNYSCWNKMEILPGLWESNSKKIEKNLAIDGLFKSRRPVHLKLFRLNPAKLDKFGLFRCDVDI
jgi:hypothetical protein